MSPTYEQIETKILGTFPHFDKSTIFGIATMIFDAYYEGVHDGIDRLSKKMGVVSHD